MRFKKSQQRPVLHNEDFQSATKVTAHLSSALEQWLQASGGCCHGHRWCKIILQSFPHLLQNCKVIMRQRAAAPAYTHSDMFRSGSGGGFSLSVIIQELTVTYFSKGPALLPSSSLSHCLSLSQLPAFFSFLYSLFFFLHFQHLSSFCSSPSLFSSSSSSQQTWPPVWLS